MEYSGSPGKRVCKEVAAAVDVLLRHLAKCGAKSATQLNERLITSSLGGKTVQKPKWCEKRREQGTVKKETEF